MDMQTIVGLIAGWLPILIPVIILQLGLLIGALVHLLRHGRARHLPVWGWVLIIVLINLIGPALYFLIGREDA